MSDLEWQPSSEYTVMEDADGHVAVMRIGISDDGVEYLYEWGVRFGDTTIEGFAENDSQAKERAKKAAQFLMAQHWL